MLVQGVFTTPEKTYTIHEVKCKGFYRIDFVDQNAEFQRDVEAVRYSLLRRRTTLVYGDGEIYAKYLDIRSRIESAHMKSTRQSEWQNGMYVTSITSVNEKLGYTVDSRLVNNVLNQSIMSGDGYRIIWIVIDDKYEMQMLPMNISAYNKIEISKDTVGDDETGMYYGIDRLKRKFDLRHIDEKDCVVATDLETARKRLRAFDKSKTLLKGFDTETTGLDIWLYGEDKMVGVILAEDENTSTYYPFRHTGDFNLPIEFLKEIADVLIRHEAELVAHNAKFDREVMLAEGYDILIGWDTLQLDIIRNPVFGKNVHGLKDLMYQLNGKRFLELDDIFVSKSLINFAVLDPELIKYYACPDGYNVIELAKWELSKIPKYQNRLARLECDLVPGKADQEFYGIRVNTVRFEQQYKNCNYIIDMLLEAIKKLTQEDRNINSKVVLSDLLYNKMHCKVLARTATGQPSTSKAAIAKLAKVRAEKVREFTQDMVDLNGDVVVKASELANSQYPVCVLLEKYSKYNKLKTAFYARFERTMKTGRVHFWINQNGAATGRQSSPMHQLPSALKDCIISDADDRDFWGPDFSQIELRMIAYLAGETELINLACDPDNDIHRIIGSLISDKPMWAITPKERSTGKRRNFGVVYLISAMGLAGQIFGPGYTPENVKFCQEQLDAFYHKFKRIAAYIKKNERLVMERGYMSTKWYNRRRVFDEVFDPNLEPRRKASIIRMGNNVPVQGTAADYLKLAEVTMYNYIRNKGWNTIMPDGFPMVRMMLSIHDEIIISAHNSIPYEEIIEMITRCMETPVDDAPPFFVQPARMDNWGGHSDDAAAMPIRYRDKVIVDYNKTHQSVFKQSYFRLEMSEEARVGLIETGNISEKVKKWLPKCRLVFDHGNYTQESTEEHLKDAMKQFILGRNTVYRIDNYIKLLNEYRHMKLDEYMKGLIEEYGTDYKIVGEKVRHPSLTHQLLDVYSDDLPKDLSHEERITEAARLFIEEMLNKSEKEVIFTAVLDDVVKPVSDKDAYAQSMEALITFDGNGNIVFDATENEVEEEYDYWDDPDPDAIISDAAYDATMVWETFNTVTIDTYGLTDEQVNYVLKYLFTKKDIDGFYTIQLIYNDKIVDTGLKIEHPNIKELNDMVIQLGKEALVNA